MERIERISSCASDNFWLHERGKPGYGHMSEEKARYVGSYAYEFPFSIRAVPVQCLSGSSNFARRRTRVN